MILSSLFAILYGDKLDTFSKSEAEHDAPRLPTSTSPSPRPVAKRQYSDEVETVSRLNLTSAHLVSLMPGDATTQLSPNEIVISTHLSEEAYIVHSVNLLSVGD